MARLLKTVAIFISSAIIYANASPPSKIRRTGTAPDFPARRAPIDIFNSTAIPAPPRPFASIKQSVGTFSYKGCFQDGVDGAPRSLAHQLNIAGGVSAESCTAACKASGFPLAGLEYGQECWCDDYMALVIPAPDSDCSIPCQADETEFCGSGNRLSVYQDTSSETPSSYLCLTNQRFINANQPFKFDLQAVPTPNGGTPVQIGTLEFAAHAGAPSYFILSTAGISHESHTYSLAGAFMRPDSFQGEGTPIALAPNIGSAQVFALFSTFTAYAGYCAKTNPVGPFGPFIGPPVLSVSGRSDQWALCTNTTAGGRIDVVYSPTATSKDYTLSGCQSVVLQMSQPI